MNIKENMVEDIRNQIQEYFVEESGSCSHIAKNVTNTSIEYIAQYLDSIQHTSTAEIIRKLKEKNNE